MIDRTFEFFEKKWRYIPPLNAQESPIDREAESAFLDMMLFALYVSVIGSELMVTEIRRNAKTDVRHIAIFTN